MENKQKNKNKPHLIKSRTLSHWRTRGVIGDLDALYEIYLDATICEYCKEPFKDTFDRCLDHCHTTGAPRAILCRGCNIKDPYKNEFL